MGAIADCTKRYRAAADHSQRAARQELATVVGRVVRAELRRSGASGADFEDVAQEITAKVVEWIERAAVTPGREDAFARSCARNAWRTHWRKKWNRDVILVVDEPAGGAVEDELLAALDRPALLALLRDAMAAAPSAYRRVLEDTYFSDTSIEELTLAELVKRGEDPNDRDARDLARNTVDVRLSRARRWLKREVLRLARGRHDDLAERGTSGGRQA